MKKYGHIALVSVLALAMTACAGDADAPESDAITETRMDDVDVIDGTISDDMVDVDAQTSADKMAEGEEAEEATDENTSGEAENSAKSQ